MRTLMLLLIAHVLERDVGGLLILLRREKVAEADEVFAVLLPLEPRHLRLRLGGWFLFHMDFIND